MTAAAAAIVVTDTARSFDTAFEALNEGFLDNHELDVELRPIEAAAAASAAAAVKVLTMPAGQACSGCCCRPTHARPTPEFGGGNANMPSSWFQGIDRF